MSWDIFIMDLPDDVASLSDIPDDYQPEPLRNGVELIAAIRDVAPTVDFTDPTWGSLRTPDSVIEFNRRADEVVSSMMLHVRGGDPVVDF